MKISIITPTYNSEKTIARTIESIISQNYPDLEYIIIDGASTDRTKEIVMSYQGKQDIKFISEPDKGIYDAMNKGVRMATGDIIGILNSDDLFDNDKVLSIVLNAFLDTAIDAVYGDITYFGSDMNAITRYWKTGEYRENKLNSGWMIPHPALFVKKSIYEKFGAFNTDFKIAADYEFILRILKKYQIHVKYIPSVFVRMFNGGTSGSNLKQRKKGWQELKKSWSFNHLSIPSFFIIRRIMNKLTQLILK